MSGSYVDASALEAYEKHGGQEFEVAEVVLGSPTEVFDAWLQDLWIAGGERVKEGVGRGLVGYVRRVPLGVEEEILSVGLPQTPTEDEINGSRIPSICYRVCKFGPFPLKSHLALVRFVGTATPAKDTPETLVCWTVKTEMSSMCNWLHCGGFVRLILRTALKSFLRSLAKKSLERAAE
ncbi:hypothetical protein PHYBOEH_002310 [Phytophthora boehmeriae]|uniref:Uncharacterized protein n=1 Tax=Phytophthora boehmeriae TaxID=109152 RepID=A0A8T1WXV0_9STRA|nr:hypothetical protein PHYBOEH_002310 [Phytophthora boehmeriae]